MIETSTPYYSDSSFTVFKIPNWRACCYQFLSVNLWGGLPSTLQKKISSWYTRFYSSPISKHIIKPYILINYQDRNYLNKFSPPTGRVGFNTFQDFFTRKFKELPKQEGSFAWPCEGLLCEEDKVGQMQCATVKGEHRTVDTVFGLENGSIPEGYSFTNVFLHNKNYHRIHAPIDGTITRIQHIPGDLVVLRPWIYKQNPSLPAFRNERYNIDITDSHGKLWYLSIVGGPAVGTISLSKSTAIGNSVSILDELALFYLGSTCCMAAPFAPRYHTKNTFVEVGVSY